MPIKCKLCGSLKIQRYGYKTVKNIKQIQYKLQRYKCSNCKHQFTNKPGLAILIKRTKK